MAHTWRFVRAGGFDQVQITTGADLEALPELDQKLWVALACPTKGIEFDARTLELLDLDKDGRIRAPELIAAVKWACEMMEDPDELTEESDTLALASIDVDEEEGRLLHATARSVLTSLGKADAEVLSVDDASKARDAFYKDPFNGDGVVPEASAPDDAQKALVRDVLACTVAPETDRSGAPGVSATSVKAFFAEIAAHAAWLEGGMTPERRPLGDGTAASFAAYAAVKAKVADYFARAKVAAYDPRALAAVNGEEKQYLELAAKDLDVTSAEVARLPLAPVAADRPLPLARGVNPAWAGKIADFAGKIVTPLVGKKDALSEGDWEAICAKLAAHEAWVATKAGVSVEKLGAARVKELAGGEQRATLDALIAADLAREAQSKAIDSLEKLVRLNRDVLSLVNNFVSFRDFYSREAPAMFQIGTLYLDTRACELCVRVSDAARHAAMAPMASTYLVYCECKNAGGESMQIAAAVMAGDVDNLMVGRNGIFYDRKGRDWDATITKIVDNPISIRQAFWSPYKKVLRMIEERIAKKATDDAAAQDAALAASVDHAHATAAGAAPPAAPPPRPRGFDIGTVAALGVAVGGITAALGMLLQAFFGLGFWMPLGVVGLVLCISGPSMAIAWLKLRKRNLGPLLDANGWAVNAQAKVNVPLGASLTQLARLPDGSVRDLSDPFAEQPRPWRSWVVLALLVAFLVAWFLGKLDPWMPDGAMSTTLLGEHAPITVMERRAAERAAAEAAADDAAADDAAPEAAAADAPAP